MCYVSIKQSVSLHASSLVQPRMALLFSSLVFAAVSVAGGADEEGAKEFVMTVQGHVIKCNYSVTGCAVIVVSWKMRLRS